MSLIPSSRGGALWRFALAAVIVVAFSAATTAVAGLLQFKQIAKYVSATPAIKHARVVVPTPGSPQTILIHGSDHRATRGRRHGRGDGLSCPRIGERENTDGAAHAGRARSRTLHVPELQP